VNTEDCNIRVSLHNLNTGHTCRKCEQQLSFWPLQLIKLQFHCITQLHSQIGLLFTVHTNAIVGVLYP